MFLTAETKSLILLLFWPEDRKIITPDKDQSTADVWKNFQI